MSKKTIEQSNEGAHQIQPRQFGLSNKIQILPPAELKKILGAFTDEVQKCIASGNDDLRDLFEAVVSRRLQSFAAETVQSVQEIGSKTNAEIEEILQAETAKLVKAAAMSSERFEEMFGDIQAQILDLQFMPDELKEYLQNTQADLENSIKQSESVIVSKIEQAEERIKAHTTREIRGVKSLLNDLPEEVAREVARALSDGENITDIIGSAESDIIRKCLDARDKEKTGDYEEILSTAKWFLDYALFDDAKIWYEKAIDKSPAEPEGYFGAALAECKIHYVHDYTSGNELPICYDSSIEFESNKYYELAVKKSSGSKRAEYISKAKHIGEIIELFRELEKKQQDYGCFICVKVSETTAGRKKKTTDCEWIGKSGLYKRLTDAGLKPFYSEIDLNEDRKYNPVRYEATILYALTKARCMILVCSDKEYLNTPWVQNEYKRFCGFLNRRGENMGQIIIVYNGEPIDLPGYRDDKWQDFDRSKEGTTAAKKKEWMDGLITAVKSRIAEAKHSIKHWKKYCPNCSPKDGVEFELNASFCSKCGGALVGYDEYFIDRVQTEREKAARIQAEVDSRIAEVQDMAERKIAEIRTESELRAALAEQKTAEAERKIAEIQAEAERKIAEAERKAKEVQTSKPKTVDVITKPVAPKQPDYPTLSNCDETEFEIKGTTLVNYNGKGDTVRIPMGIKRIGEKAFIGHSSLTSIEIPNSVTSIGERAFRGCKSLTSIEIPKGVRSIEEGAFRGCKSLTSIEIPNSVTSIGNFEFSGCSRLTSIEIPSSVRSIGMCAFKGCSSLTSIEIPDGVTCIEYEAFYGCSSLTSVEIPSSVRSIGDSAFYGCSSLTRIEIPSSVTSIGNSVFSNCSSLTSIKIPNGVRSIGKYAFSGCSSLTSIEIPTSVTSIGDYAFEGCSRLTSIEIPSSVRSIGDSAFYGCSSLTRIEIPSSVTSIGNSVFSNCSSLTSIKIPNGVRSIGKYAFSGCSSLTSIEIPDSVTSIGSFAFDCCESLTSIEIPNSVTSIEWMAFSDCESLTRVKMPRRFESKRENIFGGRYKKIKFTFTE